MYTSLYLSLSFHSLITAPHFQSLYFSLLSLLQSCRHQVDMILFSYCRFVCWSKYWQLWLRLLVGESSNSCGFICQWLRLRWRLCHFVHWWYRRFILRCSKQFCAMAQRVVPGPGVVWLGIPCICVVESSGGKPHC